MVFVEQEHRERAVQLAPGLIRDEPVRRVLTVVADDRVLRVLCVAETNAGQSGRVRSASAEVAMGVDRNAVGRARRPPRGARKNLGSPSRTTRMHSSRYMRSSWVPEPSQVDVDVIFASIARCVK